MLVTQRMTNLNEVDYDDDATITYNESRRPRAISEVNNLEMTKVSVKIYKYRQREATHARLWKEYFAENSVYPKIDFQCRFRMRRPLFNRILEAVANYDHYFVQKADTPSRLKPSPKNNCFTMPYVLWDIRRYIWDRYLTIGESTSISSLKQFCNSIVNVFGNEYLRLPTLADVQRLSTKNPARGFPGMLRSIDCLHWTWKNCLVAC